MSAEIKIQFERNCSKCYGNGYQLSDRESKVACDRCNGSGCVATRLGEELLEFLEHQGFIKANQNEPLRSNQ